MSLAIFLTDDELAQLAAMRTAAAQLKQVNPNVIGAFAPIYKWLADLLETKGVTADDQTLLWLRGATEANAGRGAMRVHGKADQAAIRARGHRCSDARCVRCSCKQLA